MDHAQRAREWLKITEDVSPDHINDCAAEAQVNALCGIGHALLAIADEINGSRTATRPIVDTAAAIADALEKRAGD
jgi:hypothetical protein